MDTLINVGPVEPANTPAAAKQFKNIVCDLENIQNSKTVVELGCGHGRFIVDGIISNLSTDTLQHIEYIGVDIDDDNLFNAGKQVDHSISKENGQSPNSGKLFNKPPRFILTEEVDREIENNSVDYVYLVSTLHDIYSIKDLVGAFHSIFRILKNDGKFIIYDKGANSRSDEIRYILWEKSNFEHLENKIRGIKLENFPKTSSENEHFEIKAEVRKISDTAPSPQAWQSAFISLFKKILNRHSEILQELERRQNEESYKDSKSEKISKDIMYSITSQLGIFKVDHENPFDFKTIVTLDLDKPRDLSKEPPSSWLRHYNAFIPLKGRQQNLEVLGSFCSDDSPFGWMLLTGDGGMGKTRLAHEFAKQQRETGWHAGFFRHESLEQLVDNDGFKQWRPLLNTLIVVDYAANKTNHLKKLLLKCLRLAESWESEENPVKLRILLLERYGTPEFGWLQELLGSGEGALRDQLQSCFEGVKKLEAPAAVAADDTMLELLELTFQGWQKITGKPASGPPKFDEAELDHFRRATQMRPLFVQMAGIHACDTGDSLGLFRWTQEDLIKSAVERERIHIRGKCPDPDLLSCLERTVALLSFTGPQSLKSQNWMELITQDAAACGFPGIQPGAVYREAKNLLGEEANGISPIGPDILAAAYSVTVLKENQETVHNLLRNILDLAGLETWTRLLRAVIDLYNIESLAIVEEWLLYQIPERSYKELILVEKLVENVSVAHRKVLANLYKISLKKVPKTDSFLLDRASLNFNLGFAYSALGQPEDALGQTKQGMEIIERLAKLSPDKFETNLASGLNNLGSNYGDIGWYKEALEPTKRSVEIYEHHVKHNPDAFEPYLAMSLSNLGIRYSDLDRHEEALDPAKRSVEIYERLAKRNPDVFESDLAMSFNSLGIRYGNLGRYEEALEATKRSVEIYERLAKRNPDAYEPGLNLCLNNLSFFYSIHERHEQALGAVNRAVEIHERLAKCNPDAFEPNLAGSYGTRGFIFKKALNIPEAIASYLNGIKAIERLFILNPKTYARLMKKLLKNYFDTCKEASAEPNPDIESLAAILDELKSDESQGVE